MTPGQRLLFRAWFLARVRSYLAAPIRRPARPRRVPHRRAPEIQVPNVGRSPARVLRAAQELVGRGSGLVAAVSAVLGALDPRTAEAVEPQVWAALRRAVDRHGVGDWEREPGRTRQQQIDALARAAHFAGGAHGQ